MRRTETISGFTLVELLVVIAIIGTLMGLLLPAVQSAREAGRRATCMNNQKNITLACIRHDDTRGYVPGWRNRFVTATGTTNPSWSVMVLPYLERNDIYKSWAPGTPPAPYLSLYVCPSSPPDSMTTPTLAYAGNCGSASNALNRRFDGVMVDTDPGITLPFKTTLDMVSEADGSTMTILISEKCLSGTTAFVPASWNTNVTTTGSFTFAGTATAVPGFGVVGTAPARVINSTALGPPGQASQPSSNHPGGVVAGFCDGHIGFLKDSLAARVYAQLLSQDNSKVAVDPASTWRGAYGILQEGDFQ